MTRKAIPVFHLPNFDDLYDAFGLRGLDQVRSRVFLLAVGFERRTDQSWHRIESEPIQSILPGRFVRRLRQIQTDKARLVPGTQLPFESTFR